MIAARQLWSAEAGRKVSLYLLTGVNDGDVVDLSPDFARVMDVHVCCVTKDPPFSVDYTLSADKAAVTVTLANQFLDDDSAYLLVVGPTRI